MTIPPISSETLRIAVHVLAMLSHTRKVSTADIHRQLQALGFVRTRRTIQRLMDDLSQSFEIDRDVSSKPYGYRWKPFATSLGLPHIDDRQALVLLLARQHLEPLLPTSVLRAMDPWFEDAFRRLDRFHGARQLRSWPYKVAVVSQLQPLARPKILPHVIEHVTDALNADQWLDVDYRNLNGDVREHKRVMPLALVQQGVRLFLVCQFEGYQDRRHLALHRILRAFNTRLPFDYPEFDLDAYVRDGRFGFGNGEFITLKMALSRTVADLLDETPVSGDQRIVRQCDGSIELTATVIRSDQLRWWIRTYGDAVRVIAPEGLLSEGALPNSKNKAL